MTLNVIRESRIDTSTDSTPSAETSNSGDFRIGQIVYFKGGPHHYRSTGDARGGTRRAGLAVVTHMARGARFPIHLIGGEYRTNVGGNSNVYGWVSADLVEAR
jgi:hypothetical protein